MPRIIATLCIVVLLGTRSVAAAPSEAEAAASARWVLIALRVLAYDKTIATRKPGDTVTIGLLAGSKAGGQKERELWQAGFAKLPRVKVGGRPVRVVMLDYKSEQAFEAALVKHAPAAVIVSSDLVGEQPAIRKITRARDVLTLTQREQAVQAGFAVGLVAGQERAEIIVNIEAAREEGVRFGAGLLQLARLVDEAR